MKTADIYKELIEISERNKLDSTNLKQFSKNDIAINIAFVGQFNAGKSTIINTMLGRKLLPTYDTPTNSVIAEISKGVEDLFEVIKIDENGNEIKYSIELSDLAQEITKSEVNKKIIIKLKNIDFLKDNLRIIDTPGVNSINEMHTEVTYGYLSHVDVAFVVLNINTDIPLSLLDFIKQFPMEQIKKIVFVLNFCDSLESYEIKKLENSISNTISQIITSPRFIYVSPLNSLSMKERNELAEYKKTGMYEIENIINKEIPDLKNIIQESRYNNYLKLELKNILELLKLQLNVITWDTEALDNQIKEISGEINNINIDLSKFKKNYEDIKNSCIKRTDEIISENIELIGIKIAKEESYDEILTLIIEDVNSTIQKALAKIKDLKFGSISNNFLKILKSAIESDTRQSKTIADLLTDSATFAATVWLIPAPSSPTTATTTAGSIVSKTAPSLGEGIGASTILAAEKSGKIIEKAGKSGKALENFGKAFGFIANLIKDINPLEKIKTAILPFILTPSLRKLVSKRFTDKLGMVFDEIETELTTIMSENFLDPIKQKEAMLKVLKKEKITIISEIDKHKENLEKDIRILNNFNN